MSLKILCVGPILPPVHGQSLAFTRFIESIDNNDKIIVNTNMEDKGKVGKIFHSFVTLFFIIFKALFFKYDVVYFTCSRSFLGSIKDLALIYFVSLKKVKMVNHLHGSDFYDFIHKSPKFYKKILLHAYNKVDTSIVLLDSMKNQFRDFPQMNIEVVPNFYDNELNKGIVIKEKGKINLVYLSNIMSSKGIFELIDAFEKLSTNHSNLYLNIAGGYIADEYMSIDDVKNKFINKIQNNSKINYLGKVYGKEKVDLLNSSDIFILPTYYKSEAFPISIIEAMACKNAIITTNYKYLPSVVSSNNGCLVEVKSIDSLIQGIENLLSDYEELSLIQENNKKEAIEKYSLDKYIKNLKRIILESK